MKRVDALVLVLLSALWGGSFLFMRVAAPELGPIWLIELRVGLTSLLLMPLVFRLDLWGEIHAHWLPMLIIGGLGSALPFVLISYASLSLPAGFNSIVNAMTPLFGTVVAAVWLKERFTLADLFGFVLGFVGVVVLVGGKARVTPAFLLAVGAGLLAAVMYATIAPFAKQRLQGVPPIASAAGSQLGAALLLVPALPFTVPEGLPSGGAIASVLALAGLSTALAYVLYFWLIQRIGSTRTLTVTYLVPVFAIVWGALVLGEALTISMFWGGALVLLGVAIANGLLRRARV